VTGHRLAKMNSETNNSWSVRTVQYNCTWGPVTETGRGLRFKPKPEEPPRLSRGTRPKTKGFGCRSIVNRSICIHSVKHPLSSFSKGERKARYELLKLTAKQIADRKSRSGLSDCTLAELLRAQSRVPAIRTLGILGIKCIETGRSWRNVRRGLGTAIYSGPSCQFTSGKLISKYAKHTLHVLQRAQRNFERWIPSEYLSKTDSCYTPQILQDVASSKLFSQREKLLRCTVRL